MSAPLTLSDLENELHSLGAGQTAKLHREDFVRLFGLNDAAEGRLVHFAKHHDCSAIWVDEMLHLRKRPQSAS